MSVDGTIFRKRLSFTRAPDWVQCELCQRAGEHLPARFVVAVDDESDRPPPVESKTLRLLCIDCSALVEARSTLPSGSAGQISSRPSNQFWGGRCQEDRRGGFKGGGKGPAETRRPLCISPFCIHRWQIGSIRTLRQALEVGGSRRAAG